MAQSILIFDFGTNEEAAQQARHKVDGWKQAFRLGDKLLLKFDREETVAEAEKDGGEAAVEESPKTARKASAKAKENTKKASVKAGAKAEKEDKTQPAARIRVFVRLAFSDHEKLSYQRWLNRIPTEEPFKSAQGETVRSGQSEFEKASEQFEALD
ncbi:MAG: hypothetical protein WA581_15695 [Candidatus Acidiferrales bacterium]